MHRLTLILLLLAPALPAQGWSISGLGINPQIGPSFPGVSADGVGDLNGDGHADIVAGKFGGFGPGIAVRVFSGVDGSPLLDAPGLGNLGRIVRGTGDLDGDGTPDFAAADYAGGTPMIQKGLVAAWSGASGATLFSKKGEVKFQSFGVCLDDLGDIDGDGLPDLAVGSNGVKLQAEILSGLDGHVLSVLLPPWLDSLFGSAVGGVGDVDLDGVPDLLVGSPGVPQISVNADGHAIVFSGATGKRIASMGSHEAGFGKHVAPAGDLDQDGRPDLLVYAPGNAFDGHVVAFSGRDGSQLMQTPNYGVSSSGMDIAGGSDVSGDGVPDFAAAFTHTSFGIDRLLVYSGADGRQLHAIAMQGGGEPVGALVGNIDAAGVGDVALADGNTGVHCRKALDGLGQPKLFGSGLVAAGEAVTLHLIGGLPHGDGLLVIGPPGFDLPMFGAVLLPVPQFVIPFAIPADGELFWHGRWPDGLPAGSKLAFQVWIPDPAGPEGWTCSAAAVATSAP